MICFKNKKYPSEPWLSTGIFYKYGLFFEKNLHFFSFCGIIKVYKDMINPYMSRMTREGGNKSCLGKVITFTMRPVAFAA